MTNPYEPPKAVAALVHDTEANRLVYIWIWLVTSVIGGMLSTPAEIFAMLQAMMFALICFLVGVAWGVKLRTSMKWTLTTICVTIAGTLATVTWGLSELSYVMIAILLGCASIILGFKSGQSILSNQRRIFMTLVASYMFGLLLGPVGTIILAVPSVLIANRIASSKSDNNALHTERHSVSN